IHRGKQQKFHTVLSDLAHGEVIGLASDRTEESLPYWTSVLVYRSFRSYRSLQRTRSMICDATTRDDFNDLTCSCVPFISTSPRLLVPTINNSAAKSIVAARGSGTVGVGTGVVQKSAVRTRSVSVAGQLGVGRRPTAHRREWPCHNAT